MACDITKHTSREGKRNKRVPIEIEEGHGPDLSTFRFSLWQEMQHEKDENLFLKEDGPKEDTQPTHQTTEIRSHAESLNQQENIFLWFVAWFRAYPYKLREAKLYKITNLRCKESKLITHVQDLS